MPKFLVSLSFRIFFLFLFSLVLLTKISIIPKASAADGNIFSTSQKISYTLNSDGFVNVIQKTTITNRQTNYRPSEFTVVTSVKGLVQIEAEDGLGPIKTTVIDESGKTTIHVVFNEISLGIGNSLNWTLSFKTKELAHKFGKVWEVYVPGVAEGEKLEENIITLYIPNKIGVPSFIKPPAQSSTDNQTFHIINWNGPLLDKGGAVVTVGNSQILDFNLLYHLKNPQLYTIQTEIALPPDTASQKIAFSGIYPKPENVKIDPDGNTIATIILSPLQSLTVSASGTAQIIISNTKTILSEQEKKELLKSQKYWEAGDVNILEIAKKYKTPSDIYHFVVSFLSYDYTRINKSTERLGAAYILKNPDQAMCSEFTDLFIAIARAAGIPSRENDGYAYTNDEKVRPVSLNQDILHAWPEYYDEVSQTWREVDPTWEKTTKGINYFDSLDLNHFTLAIRGRDSLEPYPAGSYKENGDSKDVNVVFGSSFPNEDPQASLLITYPRTTVAGFPLKGKIVIENTGSTTLLNPVFDFQIENGSLLTKIPGNLGILPPFAKKELVTDIDNKSITNFKTIKYTATINLETPTGKSLLAKSSGTFDIIPFYKTIKIQILGGIICGLAIFAIAKKTRSLFFQKRQ